MANFYPIRKYPLSSFGGEYIHSSLLNYSNSLNEVDYETIDSTTRIKTNMLNLLIQRSIKEEEKILKQMKMINKEYYNFLINGKTNVEQKINSEFDNLLQEIIDITSKENLENSTEKILTNKNLRKISKNLQNTFRNVSKELQTVNFTTVGDIMKINSELKKESALFQKTAKNIKGELSFIQENALAELKNNLYNIVKENQEVLINKSINNLKKDLEKGTFRNSYSNEIVLSTERILFNPISAKNDIKYELRNAIDDFKNSKELKTKMFEDENVKYIYVNTIRFNFNNITGLSLNILDSVYGEVMSELMNSYILEGRLNEEKNYFFILNGKVTRRSKVLKELSKEKFFGKPSFSITENFSYSDIKNLSKAKQTVLGKRIINGDNNFYAITKPVQMKYFNSLSSRYNINFNIE